MLLDAQRLLAASCAHSSTSTTELVVDCQIAPPPQARLSAPPPQRASLHPSLTSQPPISSTLLPRHHHQAADRRNLRASQKRITRARTRTLRRQVRTSRMQGTIRHSMVRGKEWKERNPNKLDGVHCRLSNTETKSRHSAKTYRCTEQSPDQIATLLNMIATEVDFHPHRGLR
jgi:hypothetical protein